MKIPIFKRDLVYTLFQNVDVNIVAYSQGQTRELVSRPEYKDSIRELRDYSYEPANLRQLRADLSTGRDVHNAIIIHQEFGNLPPSLATDERIWTAICHNDCPEFVWERWVARYDDQEKQKMEVKKHFFARVQGGRGVTRNNALSSLWWMAHVATKNCPDLPPEEAIADFVNLSDIRNAILERPTVARIPQVFQAIMSCYREKIEEDGETEFFRRTRNGGQYREWLKKINNLGGMSYFSAMNFNELKVAFMKLLRDCEKG
ncbi:DUF6339 family protein [bacterium]|nr:DUF6339 family protein [bacterium]